MVNSGREIDFWRLERIVGREMYRQKEDTSRVWTIALKNTQHNPKTVLLMRCGVVGVHVGTSENSLHTGPIMVACQWN